MSHVVSGGFPVLDLDCLAKAAEGLGMELVRGQETFKWYGHHVGDYPLPDGYNVEDMGRCLHAVRVKGQPYAYEVGVVARRDGKPGFELLWDFYAGGKGLMKVIGQNASTLKAEYGAQVQIRQANRLGYRHTIQRNAAGRVEKLEIFR